MGKVLLDDYRTNDCKEAKEYLAGKVWTRLPIADTWYRRMLLNEMVLRGTWALR